MKPGAITGMPASAAGGRQAETVSDRMNAMRRSAEGEAPPAWSMHLPWISCVLMGVGMMLFLARPGAGRNQCLPRCRPMTALPAGVTPFVGWANRLLVTDTCFGWP